MDGKTATVIFTPRAIRFASIYEPDGFHAYRDRFQFVLWADSTHLAHIGCSEGMMFLDPYIWTGKYGQHITLRSYRRPPVYTPHHPADLMIHALAILDAQNRKRDEVFNWCDSIECTVMEWAAEATYGPMQGRMMRGLSLDFINVTPKRELMK